MATITVRPGSINPDVTFERTFYGESDERQVREIVETWTRITGLNFAAMPREWSVVDSDGDAYIHVSIVHPLDNRSDVTMFWLRETKEK
jgi:hypothetical protein